MTARALLLALVLAAAVGAEAASAHHRGLAHRAGTQADSGLAGDLDPVGRTTTRSTDGVSA
jgi:hypothetical protein